MQAIGSGPRASARPDPLTPPLVLTRSGAGGVRLYALDSAAASQGLVPGMTLSDARAAVPDIAARDAEPEADKAALGRLARWCGRWTPWTAARPADPGEDSLLLETTGCERVHGGEAALLADIAAHMARLGLTARIAAAPTIGLAWGAARCLPDARPLAIPAADAPGVLARLPVAALRIDPDAAEALDALGLRHAGDLLPLRRADLARRFGVDLVRRLDQARGLEPEALDPVLPAARLRARRRYAEPLTGEDQILRAAGQTAEDLCALLEQEGLGARRVLLGLYRVDGRLLEVRIGAGAPVRDAAHLTRLLAERIARAALDTGFGVEIVEAAALTADPLRPAQTDFTEETGGADPDRLADRLAARLGEGAVLRAAARASHAPEQASFWARAEDAAPAAVRPDSRRPLLMLERPEPVEAISQLPDGPPRLFVWRRVRHRVARADGPERVAPEWWRGEGAARMTRDYFRVETVEGRRFYLYRDGLHGRDDDREEGGNSADPRWFVCGAG